MTIPMRRYGIGLRNNHLKTSSLFFVITSFIYGDFLRNGNRRFYWLRAETDIPDVYDISIEAITLLNLSPPLFALNLFLICS